MTEKIVNVEEAERTLRMVAELAAPEGLAARVKTHLAAVQVEAGERNSAGKPGQLLAWPVRLRRVDWLRSAAAAMLLAAVAGGGWSAYRWVAPASGVHTAPGAVRPAVQQGGFGSAGAMRTPKTLVGPEAPLDAAVKPAKKSATRHVKGQKAQLPEGNVTATR